MTKHEILADIKQALVELIKAKECCADDVEVLQIFHKAYVRLVHRFYLEHEERLPPQQYEAAKCDVQYFTQLLVLAEEHYRHLKVEGGRILH